MAGWSLITSTSVESSPELLLLPGLRLIKIDPQATLGGAAEPAQRRGAWRPASRCPCGCQRVELEAQQSQLQALGVDFVQGFASAPPSALDTSDVARARRVLVDPELGDIAGEGLMPLSGQDNEASSETIARKSPAARLAAVHESGCAGANPPLTAAFTLGRVTTMGKPEKDVCMSLNSLRVLEAFLDSP